MHCIYLIHKFHNLSWIHEINELSIDILSYWDAPVPRVSKVWVEQLWVQGLADGKLTRLSGTPPWNDRLFIYNFTIHFIKDYI